MKLSDFMECASDSLYIRIVNAEKREVALYNGHDSIPEGFNDFEIAEITKSEQLTRFGEKFDIDIEIDFPEGMYLCTDCEKVMHEDDFFPMYKAEKERGGTFGTDCFSEWLRVAIADGTLVKLF